MSEQYILGKYDVVVVGAGHAGCEAALATARMGKRTLLLSMNLESLAQMPCNPSIGGTGKGHLVREIDALGGEMGVNTDKTLIQMKMLNRGKGPAVHSLRAQMDKHGYHVQMKKTIESQENLDLKQGEVSQILVEDGRVIGVKMATHAIYLAAAVILCTGTFLRSEIFIGDSHHSSGPNGQAPSLALAQNLLDLGLPMRRFKTGTPARVLGASLDFSKMREEKGETPITPFSFLSDAIHREQVSCWLTYTNEETHQVIRKNFQRSALFGGKITGVGARYCPSIEDKVSRFAEKDRHQLFVEPEGLNTDEYYLQGMSTSLPEDVQEEFYRSIPGLEAVRIVRPGYAIEYECIDPMSLMSNLESRQIKNLFCAGQFNGSSGYEEAAAQGIMAGINAVLKLEGKKPFVLRRNEAYIGVLIDDLTLKGTNEPYRIMTSRAEYRLLLRQDNADERLTERSYRLGLATEERYQKYLEKKQRVAQEMERFENTWITPGEAADFLKSVGTAPLKNKATLAELMKRPEINYENIVALDPNREELPLHGATQLQVNIKYRGYVDKQLAQIEKFKKLEGRELPSSIEYGKIDGLRIEARQKLDALKPASLGQASRISGVSPADINVLMVYLEKERRRRKR